MEPRFKVGDTIWVARAGNVLCTRPCPVCFGTLAIVMTLGDQVTQVKVPCGYCSRGFAGSSGQEEYYEFTSNPIPWRITGIDMAIKSDGTAEVRYRQGTDGGWSSVDAADCFATREEALPASAAKAEARHAEQEQRMGCKFKDTRSYAWNIGYHRREIKECERKILYHTRCAELLTAKAPTGKKDDPS
jgi:hypothetical protein